MQAERGTCSYADCDRAVHGDDKRDSLGHFASRAETCNIAASGKHVRRLSCNAIAGNGWNAYSRRD